MAAIVWLRLYQTLAPASEALVAALPVDRASHLGGALQFSLYDTPKVPMLLTGVVFVMGMVNEVALTLLYLGLGLGLGLSVAVVAGWIIGRLKMEAYLEDWVRDRPKMSTQFKDSGATLADRSQGGFAAVREIVGKVWPNILGGIALGGIALGALIHGDVLEDFMASFMGKEAWWSGLRSTRCCERSRPSPISFSASQGNTMDIKVLGTGGANCKTTIALIDQIAQAKGVPVKLEKVEELRDIMGYGVMSTPGVVVNGRVVHAGGVPRRDKIEQWLTASA